MNNVKWELAEGFGSHILGVFKFGLCNRNLGSWIWRFRVITKSGSIYVYMVMHLEFLFIWVHDWVSIGVFWNRIRNLSRDSQYVLDTLKIYDLSS